MEREISEEKLSAAREYLRMRFPAMAGAPLLESRVCQYENSTDHNFILDRWRSGHGFKHGPVMGEMVADTVLRTKAPLSEMALQFAEKLTDCRAECVPQSVFLAAAFVLVFRFGLTAGPKPGSGSCSCRLQARHPDQVVGRGCNLKQPLHSPPTP